MSLSKKPPHSGPFQTLTYSRLGIQNEPQKEPQKFLNMHDLQLPHFTKPSGKAKTKSKSSTPAIFKSAIYPISTGTALNPAGTKEHLSLTPAGLIDHSPRQTEEEKTEILMGAREKAAEILAAAEVEANKIKEEVEKKAREEGLKAARAEIDERTSKLDELLKRLSTVQKYCHQKYEEEMVQLALSCTRRLLNREISLDETIITNCVREVFNESSVQGNVTLLLNHEDIQLINELRSQLLNDFPRIDGLTLEVGEGIERGGCILESTMGRIDASLRSKFEELQRLLG